MRIKKDFSKTVILFFLAIFIVVVGYTLEKDPKNQTTNLSSDKILQNWKNYQNQEYGFEIEYPSNWEIKKSLKTSAEEEIHFLVSFLDPKITEEDQGIFDYENSFVMFHLVEPPPPFINERTCETLKAEYVQDCVTDYLYVNDIKILRRTYNVKTEKWDVNARYIEFIKDDKLFHFYTASDNKGESIQSLASRELYIDKMVSTLRFVSE